MAKVMVSIPDDLLERIDREAARRSTSRSALLQAGALRELGHPAPEEFDRTVAEIRAALRNAPRVDTAALVRAERDALDARDRLRAASS